MHCFMIADRLYQYVACIESFIQPCPAGFPDHSMNMPDEMAWSQAMYSQSTYVLHNRIKRCMPTVSIRWATHCDQCLVKVE